MMTIATTARQFADMFETAKRDNGEEFIRFKDGALEWMNDAARAAHDGGSMMPNDWSYRLIRSMADHIAETLEYDGDKDLADIVDEGSDLLIPDYNADRLAWLSSHLERAGMVDEAVEEYGWPKDGGIFSAIAYGIQRELHAIGSALTEAFTQNTDDD